jgi:hypothetical protein
LLLRFNRRLGSLNARDCRKRKNLAGPRDQVEISTTQEILSSRLERRGKELGGTAITARGTGIGIGAPWGLPGGRGHLDLGVPGWKISVVAVHFIVICRRLDAAGGQVEQGAIR